MSIIDSMAAATRAASAPNKPPVLEGRIAHDVVSPTDLATVVSDDFGGGLIEQGSAPWPYRGEGVLPKRGDPVWFAEEDGGGIVIVNWQSRDSPEPYPIVPPFGDEAGTITEGDDPRLSDPREPTPYRPLWITPRFESDWADYGGTYDVRYAKNSMNFVVIRGLVTKLTEWSPSETIFQLPEGYRPSLNSFYITAVDFGVGFVDVLSGGHVRIRQGTWVRGGFVSLDGISFWAER